jgi:hypothetical protein
MRAPKPRDIQPCTQCGHPTRFWSSSIDEYPGTLQRRSTGECVRCYKPIPAPVRVTEQVRDERVQNTQTQLDGYLAARRARLAKKGKATR